MKTKMTIVLGLAAILAACNGALAATGDISINIRDLGGDPVAPGENVYADLWGYSQSLDQWIYMPKTAVSDGSGGSEVTWTADEIDAAVDVDNNDFHFMISAWGGAASANGQVESPSGLWGQFMPYDAAAGEVNWDVRTYTDAVYPATPTSTGLKYDVDLGGLTPTASWPDILVSYEGCDDFSQPVISPDKKTSMIADGYTFDETQLDTTGMLGITNTATGYDEWVSGRKDGDSYILELELLGSGSMSYDDIEKELIVDIDYDALGLSDGDRYFSQPYFAVDGPGTYTSGGVDYETDLWLNPGSVTSVLDVQYVPEPATLSLLGVGALALIRRRKRA